MDPSAGGEDGVRPLQYAWNFHGSTVDRGKSYEENQRLVGACDTVESFWRIWRATAKPSQLFRTAAQLDAVRGTPSRISAPPAASCTGARREPQTANR